MNSILTDTLDIIVSKKYGMLPENELKAKRKETMVDFLAFVLKEYVSHLPQNEKQETLKLRTTMNDTEYVETVIQRYLTDKEKFDYCVKKYLTLI